MALGKKAYPKATVKKIIKAHSNHNLKKNADVTVGHPAAALVARSRDANVDVADLPRLRPVHGIVRHPHDSIASERELTR